MRIAILCDGRTLAEWQRQAVELIAGKHELYLLACAELPARRNFIRHGAYYALNLAAIRNRLIRRVPFPNVPISGRLAVTATADGSWAVLPQQAWDWIAANRIGAIVKFGLGLLRLPESPVPILSYHHGDPRQFRGRPAGFHELQQGKPFMGQVVQLLSSRLDSGEVLAFAESRIIAHSYRKTLESAYSLSPSLLPQALLALENGRRLPIEPAAGTTGCRQTQRWRALPRSDWQVRFAAQPMELSWKSAGASPWRMSGSNLTPATPLAELQTYVGPGRRCR